MSNSANMKELLRPLGIYKLEESFLGAELDCVGHALDRVQDYLEELQREMCLTTARAEGVNKMAALFALRPVAQYSEQMAASLAALLRIGEHSFTLDAVNDAINGCGINARADETREPGVVEVRFPQVPGVPDGFERMRSIIEAILPAHVLVRYAFWFQRWEQLEQRGMTWQMAQEQRLTWTEMQEMVY